MNKSIKQIINSIESFATAHKNIAQFTANPIERNTAKAWLYPLFFLSINNATIENGQVRINITCYFLEYVGDEKDYVKKLSETLKLAEDFNTYFNKNEQDFGFYMEDSATAEAVVLDFDDRVFGWKVPYVIQTKSSQNENLIPL